MGELKKIVEYCNSRVNCNHCEFNSDEKLCSAGRPYQWDVDAMIKIVEDKE